jgi:NAD(P)H-nitrite reductase large subunit
MLISAEPHPGVTRPDLLPGLLGAKASPVEKLLVRDAAWFSRMKVDLRLNTLVTQFSIEQRAAVLATGQAVKFEKALLATGSRARRPAVAGATLGNVFYLRSARDLSGLREVVETEKNVVVVGGGFVAVETAVLLRKLKMNVTLITRSAALWTRAFPPHGWWPLAWVGIAPFLVAIRTAPGGLRAGRARAGLGAGGAVAETEGGGGSAAEAAGSGAAAG